MIHKRREYRLWQRHRNIARKKRICNNYTRYGTKVLEDGRVKLDTSFVEPMDWYEHDGQYDKGKIHCSCGLCKFSKKFGLPTFTDMKERSRYKSHIEDYLVS